ncbi:MAG: DUF362 domain-containing protein [Deltaproteobacteria bacterium]|nr:DUF362 domain-containing protein [Deltaproteobacteria bacterium]
MTRREFMEVQAKGGLFLAAAAGGLFLPRWVLASTTPDIAVVKGEAEGATRAAVDLIGGMKSVVKKGQRVLIKPNMSFPRTPAAASNTHPDVVKTVAAMCKEAGASKIRILDHTLSTGRLCVRISGIGPACEKIDADMVHTINNASFYREVVISGAKSLSKTNVAKEALKADVLIAVPVAKSHSATGVSLSMKGMMGLVYDRAVMHRIDLHETIVDLATLLKADLTVIDGSRVLSTGGPGGPGKVIREDTIIASKDMVAADAYAVAAFEWYGKKYKPTQVRHIKLAHKRGLGRADIENLSIKRVDL